MAFRISLVDRSWASECFRDGSLLLAGDVWKSSIPMILQFALFGIFTTFLVVIGEMIKTFLSLMRNDPTELTLEMEAARQALRDDWNVLSGRPIRPFGTFLRWMISPRLRNPLKRLFEGLRDRDMARVRHAMENLASVLRGYERLPIRILPEETRVLLLKWVADAQLDISSVFSGLVREQDRAMQGLPRAS